MAIRKLTYAPEESAPQPSAEIVKDFIMSPGTLRLEVSLDKEASLIQHIVWYFWFNRHTRLRSPQYIQWTRLRANSIRVLKL